MKTILKKDLFNYNRNKKIVEFVGDNGELIDDIDNPKQNDKIYAPNQTMDDYVHQTRQPNQNSGLFNFAFNYATNYSGLREDNSTQMLDPNFVKSLPSNVMNSLNQLIDSIGDVELSNDDKNNILKYIHNSFLNNGE